MPTHCHLAREVSAERCDNHKPVLYVPSHFPLAGVKTLSDLAQFGCNVSWCELLWVHPSWSPLSFLKLDVYFLPHIWEVSFIISSDCLSVCLSHLLGLP